MARSAACQPSLLAGSVIQIWAACVATVDACVTMSSKPLFCRSSCASEPSSAPTEMPSTTTSKSVPFFSVSDSCGAIPIMGMSPGQHCSVVPSEPATFCSDVVEVVTPFGTLKSISETTSTPFSCAVPIRVTSWKKQKFTFRSLSAR